ncbi:MAG: bifunctional transaldolase/phosoglucose isomerase [Pseudomonadota bacterium]
MRIALAADHAGSVIREAIAAVIRDAGHEPVILGANLNNPQDDYPVFAQLVGDALAAGKASRAVLVCGSGAGVTVAANKLPGVRAALGHDIYTAHQMVEHDHCNVMTLGARTIGEEVAKELVEAFVDASFSGEDRHRRRLREVLDMERNQQNNPLKQLHDAGQSIWLDNIRRALLDSGTLARYISTLSVTGLTSNPTIFEHAIAGSTDYDKAILDRLDKGLSTEQLFFEIALEDIVAAADLFRPIHDATDGGDGYVSLEVSPTLADDTDGTIAEAKRLHAQADRPNVFIKVPGTAAGAAAIEELIFAGIPINVTLLFSREHYLAAAEAYMRGLERRHEAEQSLDVASVASLFVSRWDVAANASLPAELHNRLGVAIGQRTFKGYQDILASERWRSLAEAGAKPQRLLWASTSAKDPALPDTFYVQALAADNTVNTMPEATLLAFGQHGRLGDLLTIDASEDAESVIAEIEKAGVSTDALAEKLQTDGRDSFDASFAQLLRSIDTKIESLREAREPEKEQLGPLAPIADAAFAELAKNDTTQRIWELDYTLWGDDPTEVSNRLGWLVSPHEMAEQVDDLTTFVQKARDDGFTHALWSGMGGSSLFPQVLEQAFGKSDSGLDLRVLDTSDPGTINDFAEALPLDKTLLLFASKSGGTLETRSHLDYFWDKLGNAEQFVAVTDKGTGLDKLGAERGFRRVFHNNPDIGGRYSALSHFGIVPGALMGVDIAELLNRAGYMLAAAGACVAPEDNPALRFGAVLGSAAKNGHDKCTLLMPEEVATFATWLEQLIAESTGKHGVGILPVAGEDLGSPDVYGEDRLFVTLGKTNSTDALAAAGHPVVQLDYTDPFSIGNEVVRWEYAIAIAGIVLGINPFDQPNVEAAKAAAAKVLDEGMPDIPVQPVESVLSTVKPGDYIAIQAYIDTQSPNIPTLQKTRMKLRDKYRVATTLGIGPRYLHSTGQLHKGGAPTGVFLQAVSDDPVDLAIPGKPFGFSQLKHAQAAGDYLALKDKGLRVARVALDELLGMGQ